MTPPDTVPAVTVIGADLDLGQDRRGVDMGPSAIRYAGLERRLTDLGYVCEDWGNVGTAVAEAIAVGDERVRFLTEVKTTCAEVARLVRKAVEDGHLPLVLGGDHSVALGTLAGLRRDGPGGVLWLDAHGDLNTPETSPDRERARDGARGGAWSRRGRVRARSLGAPCCEPVPRRARRFAHSTRGNGHCRKSSVRAFTR